MSTTLRRVGETLVGSDVLGVAVNASGSPRDLGASHFLHGGNATERPEVAVRDPGELCFDFFHDITSDVQTSICAVERLGLKAHGSIVA